MITLLVGFALKYYPGPARQLLNNSLAGVAYVVFWCLFFKLLYPQARTLKIVIIVTITTCILEFVQLWQTPFLIYHRSFWLGKILLGTTYNVFDLPWYFLGGFLGWLLLRDTEER